MENGVSSVSKLSIIGSRSFSSLSSTDAENSRPFWKNKIQHLFYFLGYCMNIRTLCSFIYEDNVTNPDSIPSIIQVLAISIIIGGPVVFIQSFIGQFTQKGCIAIGAMLPAMYGFGYCMLIVSVLDSVQTLYYSGASLFYLSTSYINFPYPSWMYCTKKMYESYPECFSRNDIDLCSPCDSGVDEPCFQSGTRILSARLYRFMEAFEKNMTIEIPEDIGLPQTKSVLHVFITIAAVYGISCRKLKSLDWSLRFSLIFCLLGSLVSLVVVFSHKGFVRGLSKLISLNFHSLPKPTCWIAAYRRVTEALRISCGGHVFLGSYMTMDTPSHFRVCYLISYFMLVILIFHFHYYLVQSLLECRLNTEDYGVQTANDISFVMYPTELGLTATPQLWCTLYFAIYWILAVVTMVLQVALIDETLSEELGIGKYYKYTRFCVCTMIFLLNLPMTSPGGTVIARVLAHELKIINLFVITLTFLILFLYNIQRLKDDIHFVLNVPPTWYIQACWIFTAILTGSMFFFQIWQYKSDNRFYIVRLVLYILIGSPIVIGFVFKLVQYIKNRNITGLFRPSIYYGAPDITTRTMRLLYNPRLEVRYRRRNEACKHRCLLNNEVATRAIDRELTLLQQITYDLAKNEEYRGEYNDIIAQLREHYNVMLVRFQDIVDQYNATRKLYK